MSIVPLLAQSAFDPEFIETLVSAFEDAWSKIEKSGSDFASPRYRRAAQEIVAKRIIEMAQRGEREPMQLAEDAEEVAVERGDVGHARDSEKKGEDGGEGGGHDQHGERDYRNRIDQCRFDGRAQLFDDVALPFNSEIFGNKAVVDVYAKRAFRKIANMTHRGFNSVAPR